MDTFPHSLLLLVHEDQEIELALFLGPRADTLNYFLIL